MTHVINQERRITRGSFVRLGEKAGIGRVIRVQDDEFVASVLVGWPEGCEWHILPELRLVRYGHSATQREELDARLSREQTGESAWWHTLERLTSSVPPAEPVRHHWIDAWFQELGATEKAVELARPDARKRRARRLWMWQARVGLPSGKPTRGAEPMPPALGTMRYLAEELRGIVHPWSAVPSGDELLLASLSIRASGDRHKQAYAEELRIARSTRLELDGETFHRIANGKNDRPDKAYVGREDRRSLDDAIFAARDPRLEGWLLDGKVSVLESRGPKPRRAIGTLSAELAARARELTSHLIVHDRRAVTVRAPFLVPVGAFAWELIPEKRTAKYFHPSVQVADRHVNRLKAALDKRGPVRLYTPDPLADSEYLNDAVREHRRAQRAILHRREQGKLADKLRRVNTEQVTFRIAAR